MGYHISEVAQKGPDGGVDIIAYTDPLGAQQPRILVQVKHKPETSIPPAEIQQLAGAMKRPSDVGIFATSGNFSSNAKKEARNSGQHIELIELIYGKNITRTYLMNKKIYYPYIQSIF